MTAAQLEGVLRPAWARWTMRNAAATVRLSPHVRGLGGLVVAALWLTRHWLLSGALPAGTDMLGFVSRAEQNRGLGRALSLWDPAAWGGRRTITLESLLGLATSVTRDPILTVKLFSLLLLLSSGVCAYALAWRVSGSRLASFFAGLLYMGSQESLAHWASGHVNVEVGIALTPLLLLFWIDGVRTFSVARGCALAFTASFVVLARPDLLLYPIPFMVLYVPVRIVLGPGGCRTLQNAARTAALAVAGTFALSLYILVPALDGIRAHWLSGGGLFDLSQLVGRSVSAYTSLLGFAREIGYLAFTGQQTWSSHPWLPFWMYAGCASLVVALAYVGVAIRRDEYVLYLGAAALIAGFMAKGIRGPVGDPYLWLVHHVPVFGDLRDPNRWEIIESLAYAVLAGVAASAVERRLRSYGSASVVATAGVAILVLLPAGPTLVAGLKTVPVTAGQEKLLSAVRGDSQQSLVASVPYDQTYRFVDRKMYSGWEHDLGSESATFTNHAALGDGGWDLQSADTVAFTSTLLRQRDPAFAKLLGTLGIEYLVDFAYPETAPHLLAAGGPFSQQKAISGLPGLQAVVSNSAGVLFRLNAFSPIVSFRPHVALVLGGRAGLSAFADLRSIDLRSWAVFTADDVLAHGGMRELLSLARRADALVVDDATPRDLAVLAAPAVASLPGITSDPGLDQETQIVPSDASVRLGSLANEDAVPARILRSSSSVTFRSVLPQTLELWARVRSNESPARLEFGVDGSHIASLLPLTAVGGGFRWYLVATRPFSVGTHRVRVSADSSQFGRAYEVDEAKLVDPSTVDRLTSQFTGLVRSSAAKSIVSYTPSQIQPPLSVTSLGSNSLEVTTSRPGFWRVVGSSRIQSESTANAFVVTLAPHRRYHTFVEHIYGRGLNWSGFDHLILRFRGTGNGATYRLVVDFNRAHLGSAAFLFEDRRSGWQTAVFGGLGAVGGGARWSHVTAIRVAADDRNAPGVLALGSLRASRAASRELRLPIAPSLAKRVAVFGGSRIVVPAGANRIKVKLSRFTLGSPSRVILEPAREPFSPAPPHVLFVRTGVASYRFHVSTPVAGVLMFAQAFDPRWHAVVAGYQLPHVSTYALANGYLLPPGSYTGTIRFVGNGAAGLGAGLSALSAIGLLGIAFGSGRVRRRPWT